MQPLLLFKVDNETSYLEVFRGVVVRTTYLIVSHDDAGGAWNSSVLGEPSKLSGKEKERRVFKREGGRKERKGE